MIVARPALSEFHLLGSYSLSLFIGKWVKRSSWELSTEPKVAEPADKGPFPHTHRASLRRRSIESRTGRILKLSQLNKQMQKY